MRMGGWKKTAAALLALALLGAACGDEGGELREATARRRAERAGRDSSGDSVVISAADTASGDARLPAFAGDSVHRAAPARVDSVRPDSAARPADAGWSLASRQGGRAGAPATLRGLRSASQDGFDRLVLDFGSDAVPGWHAEYASRPGLRCGSGEPVQLSGDHFLRLRLQTAQAHDEQGQPTLRQRQLTLNMPALHELALVCDYEGEVSLVLGVNAENPYRVLQLQQPSRLVVDVKQQP